MVNAFSLRCQPPSADFSQRDASHRFAALLLTTVQKACAASAGLFGHAMVGAAGAAGAAGVGGAGAPGTAGGAAGGGATTTVGAGSKTA